MEERDSIISKNLVEKENPKIIKKNQRKDDITDEESCDIQCDFNDLNIYSPDGCLVHIDDICKMLFFVDFPEMKCNNLNGENPGSYRKFVCELRLSKPVLKFIISGLINEIKKFEKYEKEIDLLSDFLKKEKTGQQVMFG